METYIVLILEDENDIYQHIFNSTSGLEDFVKNNDITLFERTNILFYIDDECNHKMSDIFKKRYLNKL